MTASNIWAAFREHAAKTSDKTWDDFQREQREPVPYESLAQRRTAMTRLRERYPSVFATVDAPPSFASQWARIEALAAAYQASAPERLSDRALELVGVRPPRKPDNAPLPPAGVETPEAPPIEEDERMTDWDNDDPDDYEDPRDRDPCDHPDQYLDYDILTWRAHCGLCGEAWWASKAEMDAEMTFRCEYAESEGGHCYGAWTISRDLHLE